jgi:dihydroorotase-like cyclic amidohydrolase
MLRSIEELIEIARAGGGFRLDASRCSTEDVLRVARVAGECGAQVHISRIYSKSTDDLIKIASAAKGHVFFEL